MCAADAENQHIDGNVKLTQEQYNELINDYGKSVVDDYIGRVNDYINNSNVKPYSNHYQTLLKWLKKDDVKKKSEHSYDLDAFVEHMKNNIPTL